MALLRLPAALGARPPSFFVGCAALAAITLPPLVLGPWLPLHDLVAFVGLGAYPGGQSDGPLVFGIFQFSYIIHYILSRFLTGLAVPVPAQILFFYLLQAGVFFLVQWRLATRLIADDRLRAIVLAVGALAFWEGQFLSGGPLPFSLGTTALTGALLLIVRELETDTPRGLGVFFLSVIGVLCHPFVLLFALLLIGLRFLLVARRRTGSLLLLLTLAGLGWVIRGENSGETIALESWFRLAQIPERIAELFTAEIRDVANLFGFIPTGLDWYFWLLGALRLASFVLAPLLIWRARAQPVLRFIALLNLAVGLGYFLTPGLETLLPGWPQRVLASFKVVALVTAFAGFEFLWRARRPADAAPAASPAPLWSQAITGAILVGIILIQAPVLRLSASVRDNYHRLRDQIVATGVANAFLVTADLKTIRPHYLRSVSFLLFSDPELVARHIVLFTEWHVQPRHPSRLAESSFETSRPKILARFAERNGQLDVTLEPAPNGERPLPTNNNSLDAADVANVALRFGNKLYAAGAVRDALPHYEAAVRLAPRSWQAQANLGVAYALTGRLDEARRALEVVLHEQPKHQQAHRLLGIIYLEASRLDEAARYFRTALELDPNDKIAQEGLRRTGR